MSTHRRGHQPEWQEGSGGEEKQRLGTDVARHQPLAKKAGREDYKKQIKKSLFESVFHLLTSSGIATWTQAAAADNEENISPVLAMSHGIQS